NVLEVSAGAMLKALITGEGAPEELAPAEALSATTLLPLWPKPGRTRRKGGQSGSSGFRWPRASWGWGVSPRSGFVISRSPVRLRRVALEDSATCGALAGGCAKLVAVAVAVPIRSTALRKESADRCV